MIRSKNWMIRVYWIGASFFLLINLMQIRWHDSLFTSPTLAVNATYSYKKTMLHLPFVDHGLATVRMIEKTDNENRHDAALHLGWIGSSMMGFSMETGTSGSKELKNQAVSFGSAIRISNSKKQQSKILWLLLSSQVFYLAYLFCLFYLVGQLLTLFMQNQAFSSVSMSIINYLIPLLILHEVISIIIQINLLITANISDLNDLMAFSFWIRQISIHWQYLVLAGILFLMNKALYVGQQIKKENELTI